MPPRNVGFSPYFYGERGGAAFPLTSQLFICRFSIANAAWFVKIPDNRKPKAAVCRGFRSNGSEDPYSVPRDSGNINRWYLFPLDGCRRLAGHVVEDHVDGEPCRLNAADNVRECVLGEIHTGDG